MNTDQKYKLLSMMGYKGPKNESLMSSFVESNPAAGAKMGQFMSASKGFNQGGFVPGGGDFQVSWGGERKSFSTPQEAFAWLNEQKRLNPSGGPTPSTGATQGSTNPVTPPTTTPSGGTPTGGVTPPVVQTPVVTQPPVTNTGGAPTPTPQPTPTPGGTQTGGSLPIAPTGNPQQDITALYQQYLGRDPQTNGLNFYTGLLNQGIPLEQIAQDIERNSVSERTVRTAYTDILGRAPDQAGLEFYTGLLNSGQMTIEQIRQDIQQNSGNAGAVPGGDQAPVPPYTVDLEDPIQQAYFDYFGRAGDQTGLAYWTEQRALGVPEADIIAELQRVGGAGTTFTPEGEDQINQLNQFRDTYRAIFGRNPDQAGLDFWMNAVASGQVTIAEALTQIANSEEAQLIDNQRFEEARELRANQQRILESAFGSPQDLVAPQEVAEIRPTEGTIIAGDAGQIRTPAGSLGYTPTTVQQGDVSTATAAPRSEVETYKATTVSEGVNNVLAGLEAQTADPTDLATVQGQLTELMKDFDGGKRPPWASGVMRETMAVMQQRGLGASSMAGMAVVQSAMEAATNIAQQDAQTFATFELQNLNNRQQTAIFKTQQRMAGLFSDQAALNAQKQFNASSINQYNQFREQLETQASQFNAAQINSMTAMNMDAENAAKQFNSSLTNQREQFNANNSLIVSQANAQWRQNINTINTAAQNDANRDYVKTINAISTAALDQLWQRERDLMTFAFSGSESSLDRELQLLLAEKQEDLVRWQEDKAEDAAWGELLGSVVSKVFDW